MDKFCIFVSRYDHWDYNLIVSWRNNCLFSFFKNSFLIYYGGFPFPFFFHFLKNSNQEALKFEPRSIDSGDKLSMQWSRVDKVSCFFSRLVGFFISDYTSVGSDPGYNNRIMLPFSFFFPQLNFAIHDANYVGVIRTVAASDACFITPSVDASIALLGQTRVSLCTYVYICRSRSRELNRRYFLRATEPCNRTH